MMLEISKILTGHRSIRKFKADDIPAQTVEAVCSEAFAGASSSGNLNTASIIATREPSRRRDLYQMHEQQKMILESPLMLTFCADLFRTRKWLARRAARDNFNNLEGFFSGALDAMILAQNVCLGFEARGLGICYLGTTFASMAPLARFFDLPETCLPITTVAIGVPDENPSKRDRLPLKAIFHEEVYRVPSTPELDEIYADREIKAWERYISMPGNKARFEEGGIMNVAQWYTSKYKYPPEQYEAASLAFQHALVEQCFMARKNKV